MDKVYCVRFSGEVWIKGEKNLRKQINHLIKNLKLPKSWIETYRDRILIHAIDPEFIEDRLKKTFGISSYSLGYYSKDKSLESIKHLVDKIIENWKNIKSFKVDASRADKKYPLTSLDINRLVGEYIVKKYDLKVDLKNPDKIIHIEIRQKFVFVTDNIKKGLGGLPSGFSGKAISLISGGFDSAAASWLALKRGLEIIPVHFYINDKNYENFKETVNILSEYGRVSNEIVINHRRWLEETSKILENYGYKRYLCVICKRKMLKEVEKICEKENTRCVITGDNIGQVASQTISNMFAISYKINLNIIRPVICYDKEEIISLVKNIGLYEKIKSAEDCPFAPKHPIINADHKKVLQIEKIINKW